jgi:ADP-ribose pyrophosphatase YjhB (NUDIX family)
MPARVGAKQPVRQLKRLLDLAYGLQRQFWKLFRPRTRGVKVMLFNDAGEIMLIRNSYGRSDLFVLPGGGIRPIEAAERAARREVREELGCEVVELELVSTHFSASEGKRDTIHLFTARAAGRAQHDNLEVEEARYFAMDALPRNISAATLRRIDEQFGKRPRDGTW